MNTHTKAFTIIETLVAITILVIAIVGPMYSIRTALVTSYTARDKLIATSLAQESIELVRQRRDNNYLYNRENQGANRSWMYGLEDLSCYSSNSTNSTFCTTDSGQDTIEVCSGDCLPLFLTANKVYSQVGSLGATETTFVRKMQLYEATPDEVRISVTVSWTTNTQPYSVTITDALYNWL